MVSFRKPIAREIDKRDRIIRAVGREIDLWTRVIEERIVGVVATREDNKRAGAEAAARAMVASLGA